ncbi:MAG: hypothetical protein K2Q26_08965 [Bdellovibrionales bacterium]|nr:hypothetical protein [Bdellovibrionales bacterium]
MPKKYYLIFTFLFTTEAHTFLGDGGAGWAQIPYLIKILDENYKRYKQLQIMIESMKNQESFVQNLSSGVDNSIGIIESLPIENEKILTDLKNFKKSYDSVLDLYGSIPTSKDEALQRLHDRTVAESFKMVSLSENHTRVQEENADAIRHHARNASLKGATRMTAESNALILDSLNQLIKLQSQSLKMQSEQLALNNRSDKSNVSSFQKVNRDLKSGFQSFKPTKGMPKF